MIPLYQMLQNGTLYEIALARDDGARLATLDTVGKFSYTLALNRPGAFSLVLPADFDRRKIAKDRRVTIWRRPLGGANRIAFAGLVRLIDTAGAPPVRTLAGPCMNVLLEQREVAYAAGSTQADQSGAADTIAVNIVTQNHGSSATAARQFPAAYFGAAASPAGASTATKAFSYRNALDVLTELANTARQVGTGFYFGVVPTSETQVEFRTRTNEWGRDRTADTGTGLIFGVEYGNMENPHFTEDYTAEINVVYGLGQDDGPARSVQTAEDTARSGLSIWARSEASVNASSEPTDAGVLAAARARVIAGRPRLAFTADLLSVPGAVYGKDWDFGDRVTCTYDGRQFDALVRAVTVSVNETGAERIDAKLEALL